VTDVQANATVAQSASHTLTPFQDMLVRHLPEVHRAVRSLARRHRLPADEEGDLLSEVLIRLVADDYAVLRKYRGQSALGTYLRVVAYRVLLDGRIRRWGKWRPSRRALALGAVAVRLERLVGREGLTEREALSAMKDWTDEELDPNVAHAIAARAGRRGRARELPLELGAHAAVDALQERVLESRDLARSAAHVAAVIREALRELSDEDYELLHRRFVRGESVADLARKSGVDQKWLYRRHEQILRRLRLNLGRARLVRHDLRALIGHPDVEVPEVFEERLSA
jgi:RNA polymerase sigma factor (sigma-70 family)